MPKTLKTAFALFLLFSLFNCGGRSGSDVDQRAGQPSDTGVVPSGTAPSPTNSNSSYFVMDFAQAPHSMIQVGNTTNVRFSLDLSQSLHHYVPSKDFKGSVGGLIGPNVRVNYEMGDYCKPFITPDVLPSVADVGPGDAAIVNHVDVELSATHEPTGWPNPEPDYNRMCFGFRNPEGKWTWHLEEQEALWNPNPQRYQISFKLNNTKIDGFKILFSLGSTRFLEKVTIATVSGLPECFSP
jgi:hypothetical protein